MGGIAYAYNGLGDRISQTANSIVTEYLNDVQPGLVKVLAQTVGSDTTRFVHGPRGIQAMEDSAGWTYPVQDGLGSVRDGGLGYSPYGVPDDAITGFAFTGEVRDANGLQFHRARYYVPDLGVWASLDPVEDSNRYAYVGGNPVTRIDPSGMIFENPYQYDSCKPQQTSGNCDQFCGVDIDRFLDCRKQTGGRICPTGWVQTGQANDPVCQLGLAYSPPSEAFLLSREWENCSGVEWGVDVSYMGVFAMPFGGASVNIVQPLARWALLGFTIGAATSVLAPPSNPSVWDNAHEYRIKGFDEQVGTLAEHLAKLLEHDVAGYPPSYPNPEHYPDRGWCNTVRRIIEVIDRAGYSERQFSRDLERAGFGGGKWGEIVNAMKEVVERGLCDDHWGDFNGGSLATG
jgi:RHS repeat-associated protein